MMVALLIAFVLNSLMVGGVYLWLRRRASRVSPAPVRLRRRTRDGRR